MGYLSYGHEAVISVVFLLIFFHVVLDVIPMLYKRLRPLLASAPLNIGGVFILLLLVSLLI